MHHSLTSAYIPHFIDNLLSTNGHTYRQTDIWDPLKMCHVTPTTPISGVLTKHSWNGRISNFQGLVTLTLDRVILHTIMHHSLTSAYMPNFIDNFLSPKGRRYRQTDIWDTLKMCRVTPTTPISGVLCHYKARTRYNRGGTSFWYVTSHPGPLSLSSFRGQ